MASDRRPVAQQVNIGKGHSPGVTAAELTALDAIVESFGPCDTRFGAALIVRRIGNRIAIIRVAEISLQFDALIVEPTDYQYFAGCDPFWVSEQFTPDPRGIGDLPEREWRDFNPDRRSVDALQEVLRTGDSPLLLGAVQTVVDGGKVAFERPESATELVRNIWRLLPFTTRAETSFATFAPNLNLGCDVMVVPKVEALPPGFLSEENVLDYPEGRYEKHLQIAIEDGDQAALGRLFWRRTSDQTLRLAWRLVVASLVVALAMKVMFGGVARGN